MEGQGENDELYPIAVLIDELKVCQPVPMAPRALQMTVDGSNAWLF
jgi:hypothetical protein